MKYLSASSLSVGLISILVTLSALIGFYQYEFTLIEYLTILFFYFMYSGIGIGMMFHRYWTHRSFEFKNPLIKWLFTYFGLVTGRGSILGWVHVHREHHMYSDTEKDPHIANMGFLKIFLPIFSDHGKNINKRLIKDLLTKEQININKYYVPIVFVLPLIIFLINPWLFYFTWAIPVFITNIVWNSFIYYGHYSAFGYRSYETNDKSINSWIFGLLIFGEGWHNNHHKYPNSITTKIKWWEFDFIGKLIILLK